MNKTAKRMLYAILIIALGWTVLTVWVQYAGGEKVAHYGSEGAPKTALVVYNPDPIYNLDEQVCVSVAEGLAVQNFRVKVATVKAARKDTSAYDRYVFCANTYNWAPDWLITKYIADHPHLKGANVVALTLGSGSTEQAQRKLDQAIRATGAHLIRSEALWLLRPNDDDRMEEKNTAVAKDIARELGLDIGKELNALE